MTFYARLVPGVVGARGFASPSPLVAFEWPVMGNPSRLNP